MLSRTQNQERSWQFRLIAVVFAWISARLTFFLSDFGEQENVAFLFFVDYFFLAALSLYSLFA